tara:strand:- start:3974 stop:4801 length:828 start_codon:yes stop_codon:yes gene_type:complete
MRYKLQFIKISPTHEFAGVGFAGNIFITLNALTHLGEGDKLFVDMETNECVCTERGVTLHDTNNSWEYYFDQTTIEEGEPIKRMDSLVSANISYEDRDVFMYPNNFAELKEKFFDSFQLKPYLVKLLDDYYNENIKGKVTLGMQVRLTDMKHYHNVSPVSSYIDRVKEILKNKTEIEQIFLATDDGTVIESIREALDIPVLCYEDMFRADAVNPHLHPYDRFKADREQHRYKLGIECIQEIFTLAKCDYLFKADISSISIIASILSENIKEVYKL